MMIRLVATLALLGLYHTAGAVRVLDQLERPFEVSLAQLTLPRDTGGWLTLHECASCRFSTYQLEGTTKFVLDKREVAYADFMRAMDALRGSSAGDATVVSVFVDRTTEHVTRVTVHRPRR
jgi:hypothetical protein